MSSIKSKNRKRRPPTPRPDGTLSSLMVEEIRKFHQEGHPIHVIHHHYISQGMDVSYQVIYNAATGRTYRG